MRPGVKAALAVALAVSGVSAVIVGVSSDAGEVRQARVGTGARAGSSVPAGADRSPDGRLVLVSGRDDHGLLATARVTVWDQPNRGAPVGEVADGTLARVVSIRGSQLEVRTVEGPPVQGWVDDFYLRGVVHLVGPGPTCRVQLDATWLPAGEQAIVLDVRDGRAQVRVARTGQTGWVRRAELRELAPEPDECGPSASG